MEGLCWDWHGFLREKYATRHPLPFEERKRIESVQRIVSDQLMTQGREFYELARTFALGLGEDIPADVLQSTLLRLHELDTSLRVLETLVKE